MLALSILDYSGEHKASTRTTPSNPKGAALAQHTFFTGENTKGILEGKPSAPSKQHLSRIIFMATFCKKMEVKKGWACYCPQYK